MDEVERATERLARSIAAAGEGRRSKVFHLSFLSDRLLARAMARPAFRTRLFHLVDVLPATRSPDDVADHIREYLGDPSAPAYVRAALRASDALPGGEAVANRLARSNVERMAGQFIAGTSAAEAVAAMQALWHAGRAHTVDVLGEKTVVPSDADRYAARVDELLTALADDAAHWPASPRLETDDLGPLPRVNVSVKPTALATHYTPLGADIGLHRAAERLRPILRRARDRDAFVHVDMEHGDVKDLTLELFRTLLEEPEFATLHAGVVIQAYRTDSYDDLRDLVSWSARRAVPVTVRLVKGAYWDTETVEARAAGWPPSVYEVKDGTDANFERCVRLLHDHHGEVRAAFGSHNLRSIAYAIASAQERGIPDDGYELQLLHGMAEPVHHGLTALGFRVRVYAPVGALVPGMAYLVRRLLENTSNESFVRQRFAEHEDLRTLLAAPSADGLPEPAEPAERAPTESGHPTAYEPEPVREWRRTRTRARFAAAVDRRRESGVRRVPAFIGGVEVDTTAHLERCDPADPSTLVTVSASCDSDDAHRAVAEAADAVDAWRHAPARDRAAVLFGAAAHLRARRDEVAAVEVFEAGKPWDQSDADVCEAIDFCEYYGRELLRLGAGGAVQSPPGERNRLSYQGKGVAVVVAPWNFPLAIPTGMTVAALAAGNPTILKPAEQTPAVAWCLADALRAAGVPPGVFQFLPGLGETVGAALVEHPEVAVIAFTGSMAVGLAINEAAAVARPGQRHVKRVIAEMGGKNALFIDADADPDQAVPGAVTSAFGFSGQKCSAASRLLVHEAVYDEIVGRLVEAVADLVVGHPATMGTQVGPLIDDAALANTRRSIEAAHAEGQVLISRADVPDHGWFAPPTVVHDLPDDARVMTEEIFGPLLAVRRVADVDEALSVANATSYALTSGIYSRTPSHIDRFTGGVRAGNVYVNRPTTGAVVGRQPFGGFGLSGVGSKAGGPDYLLQFLDPRVVTENTVRQGFAADE